MFFPELVQLPPFRLQLLGQGLYDLVDLQTGKESQDGEDGAPHFIWGVANEGSELPDILPRSLCIYLSILKAFINRLDISKISFKNSVVGNLPGATCQEWVKPE